MLKSPRCFPWASETSHASPSTALPSQRGSIACDAGWWSGPWVGGLAWPRPGRAWDAGKSRSHRQRPTRLSRLALGFGGVFFQPAPKTDNSFVAGLDIAIDWTLQDEAQPLEPVSRLAGFEFDLAFFAQKLDHHHAIPVASLQAELFWRLRQCLLQLVLGHAVQSGRPARTRNIVNAVGSLPVGFANPVHHRLATQPEQAADGGRFPSRQKQQQAGDPDAYPSPWNRVGHAQQRLGGHCRMGNFQRFHAWSLYPNRY